MRRIALSAILAALATLSGIVVSIKIGSRDGHQRQTMVELTSGTFSVQSANAAATARLSKEQAEAIAMAAIDEKLSGRNDTVNGQAIHASDLSLVDSAFAPATVKASSSVGHFTFSIRGGPPEDLWLFIFRKGGVSVPKLGLNAATVEAQVVINDKLERVETANIGEYNPIPPATPLPPVVPTP